MKTIKNILLAVQAGVVLMCSLSQAGERSNIRGMGMAGTFSATSRGLDAVGINPANLAMPDEGVLAVSLFPAGFHIGSEFLNYDLYTRYFTGLDTDSGRVGRYLNEDDKQHILDAFSTRVPHSRVDLEATLFGAAYRDEDAGGIAFTVSEQAAGFVSIPRDYAEFILNGNPPGSVFEFGDTRLQASWTREYAMSFGAVIARNSPVKFLAAGVALKLVHGYGYYRIENFDARLSTANDGVLTGDIHYLSRYAGTMPFENSFELFPRPLGLGLGTDLGFAGELNDVFSFGISVTDIGRVHWKEGITESYADTVLVVDDPLREDQRTAIENVLKGRKREGEEFSSSLPTTLRFGVALAVHEISFLRGMPGELLLAVDYNQGLVVTARSTTRPRGSFGVEYKPVSWLPLRTGVSIGGTDKANVAMGFGVMLGFFELEAATENVSWLFEPQSFSYGSAAVGARVRF